MTVNRMIVRIIYKSKILTHEFINVHQLYIYDVEATQKYVKGILENYHDINK